MNGVDYANFFRVERSLLCPEQWEVVQSGDGPSSGTWVRLEIHRYDPVLPFLAVPLAQELLEDALELDQDIWWTAPKEERVTWTTTEYPGSGPDYLATARQEDPGFQVAVVAGNGRAAVVKYTGKGDLTEHLAQIAAVTQSH